MNKPLLLSLAAAALLSTNLNAQSMLERFEAMEREMNQLRQEIAALKSSKIAAPADEEEEGDEEEEASDQESSDDEDAVRTVASVEEDEDEDEEDGEDIISDEERISDLEETVSELNRRTSGSHLKFKVDYRFAIENINYEMADGSEAKNNGFMTNRLWIDMGYKATNNLSFIGQLAYNKAFGARSGTSGTNASLDGFDWIANENAYDDQIRVRSAYFLWQEQEFMGLDVPWTFSIGRRPSTGGHLVNLRDDDKPNSPLGHSINVEFDGLSSQFTLNKEWGTSVKLCLGRGMSNAAPKFAGTPYADNDANANPDMDIAGLIFTPYDDRQYKFSALYYYADNLIDVKNPNDYSAGFDTVGGMHSVTAYFSINGIGNEISDFLDDTTFFISGAASVTNPKDGMAMLGSTETETGTSYWIGTQFPSLLTEDGRWGLEYNHGSKYWRSITYGEDTNIGSKLAARGDAYEAYMTEYLVDDILSMQLRYTYIDYKYSGSNGFFGGSADGSTGSGTPFLINSSMGNAANYVDTAQDIRLYIRYRY
ncbi:MAG: DUF3373 domain-containing protein [Sulfurimonas sp.]|nr:DUF3373 domain-containing protein [Sulfurimonas sp.]